ncbi:glutaredoxin family protein [Corynebacterium sp. sy017]|uniref:glutaredoxin family protein n=1 Tax=unclassified Corynebacterium TaxID=2624378 RepID=UPI0011851D35|nr:MULTISPECIES: glutaredoxin family protein [unclassified Corynebacterium]MBP3089325.1 glutaredoxin family protein [Corynebacterium sp. sy017]QDZ43261.1 glutaredoxin family protein [Corynebacterium sp. sy039]TSD90976.1 glutaredoxin family protein [Corynebacterium sp. SY003]
MSAENAHHVVLLSRRSCGSCARVAQQIEPVVAQAGASFQILDVDSDSDLAAEFGDRVPVVLIDDEEFACWEVDNAELAQALL